MTDESVFIGNRFFSLESEPSDPDLMSMYPLPSPGLSLGGTDLTAGVVAIWTGIYSGPIRLVVETSDSAPPLEAADWEDIEELSHMALSGDTRVCGADAQIESGFPDSVTKHGAGEYRVRIHASGRDINYDLATDEASESYLIQVWPQEISDPIRCKGSSQMSREWIVE